jgi:hypothetical protein
VTGAGWVSLLALTGWLVLALGSYRAHRVGARKTVVVAMTWLAIFFLVTGIFVAIGG